MQSLTNFQGNAILDVVQQCWVVYQTYEQHHANVKDERMRLRYKEEVEMLIEYYGLAVKGGVHDDVLAGVLVKNLPRGLGLAIELKEGA